MSTTPITLRGTVRPDGTLNLEAPLPLPPGPVRVTIQTDAGSGAWSPDRGVIEVLDAIDASQRARGFLGRPTEEMEADMAGLGSEDDEDRARWRTIGARTVSGPPPEVSP